MSAWTVENGHIDVLVNALAEYGIDCQRGDGASSEYAMTTCVLPATTEPRNSESTVRFAFAMNVGVATVKAVAGFTLGSPALLAEAAHSTVNCGSQALLVVGAWHARYRPRARYGWALTAAVNMFAVGGCYAVYEGVGTIAGGEAASGLLWVGLLVLAVSFAADGASWCNAVRTLARSRAGKPWVVHIRTSEATDVKAILFEDTADLLGLVLAGVGLGLHLATGSVVADGVASVLIGLLLTVMAFELGRQNVRLLRTKEA